MDRAVEGAPVKKLSWGIVGVLAIVAGSAIGWHLFDRWRPRKDTRGPHIYPRRWA
jgi:hypothetical protein